MRRRTRVPFVLVWIALSCASVDLESLRHAHSDWQQHLQAHELATVEATDSCGSAPHWDRAHRDRQPACVACVFSATPYDRATAPVAAIRGMPPPAAGSTLASPAPCRILASPRRGRAPPGGLRTVS